MMSQEPFSAIILAAGTSSRMGRPKQTLEVNGVCMLDHTIRAALDAELSPPTVILGAHAQQIQSQSSLLDQCTVVFNENYNEGLSTSLIAGVINSPPQCTAYIFMLADQPFVRGELLLKMMDKFTKTGADIVFPEYKGKRGNPVIITSKLRSRLLLARGDRGARFLFTDKTLHIVSLEVNSSAAITDIDTPKDYQNIYTP